MSDLTRVTVNMLPVAIDALQEVHDRTGLSRTDALNRAMQLYRLWLDLADEHGTVTVVRDGTQERVTIL